MIRYTKKRVGDRLLINSVYIALVSGVSALFGFLFWLIAARALPAAAVGLGSAAVSAALLIGSLSQTGLGYGLVHHARSAADPPRLINLTFTWIALISTAAALIFLGGLPRWSPALVSLKDQPLSTLLLAALILLWALHLHLHWVFLAWRRPDYTLLKQLFQIAVACLLLAFLTARWRSAAAVLLAYTAAAAASLIIALAILLPRLLNGYRFRLLRPHRLPPHFTGYALVNYAADQLQRLPDSLMPLLVVNLLGPSSGAYFYVPWAITTGLQALAGAAALSLFAEGSHDTHSTSKLSLRALALSLLAALGLALAVAVGGRPLLALYGPNYASRGTLLLRLLALSILPQAVLSVTMSRLRIQDRRRHLLLLAALSLASGLLAVQLGMAHFGLVGTGGGWLLSRLIVAAAAVAAWRHRSAAVGRLAEIQESA